MKNISITTESNTSPNVLSFIPSNMSTNQALESLERIGNFSYHTLMKIIWFTLLMNIYFFLSEEALIARINMSTSRAVESTERLGNLSYFMSLDNHILMKITWLT